MIRHLFLLGAALSVSASAREADSPLLFQVTGPVRSVQYKLSTKRQDETAVYQHEGRVLFGDAGQPIRLEESRTGGPYASDAREISAYTYEGQCLKTQATWAEFPDSESEHDISTYNSVPCLPFSAEKYEDGYYNYLRILKGDAPLQVLKWKNSLGDEITDKFSCANERSCTFESRLFRPSSGAQEDVKTSLTYSADGILLRMRSVWSSGGFWSDGEHNYDAQGRISSSHYRYKTPGEEPAETTYSYAYGGSDARGNWTWRTRHKTDSHTGYVFDQRAERTITYR